MSIRVAENWRDIPVYNGSLEPARESTQAGLSDADLYAFRKIDGEDRTDILDEETFNRYQRLALWLYYQNPLARRLAALPTDMVLGAGFKIDTLKDGDADEDAADDPESLKGLIDRFRDNPANKFDLRIGEWFTLLNSVTGELFLPVGIAANGDVALGFLDYSRVQEVKFNPKNQLEAVAVIQKPPNPGDRPVWWNVIRAQQGADEARFPKHPGLSDEPPSVSDEYTYGGELFYFDANHLGTGRGRTSMEPVLDWLNAYDNFLFGDLRNANLQSAFVWDITIEGADLAALQMKRKELMENPPVHGEVMIHNEKEVWDAKSPKLNAADHSVLGIQIKKLIGLATGIPPHLIAAEGDTNRTSSVSSDTPFVRGMERRQTLLHYVIRTILDYQIDQKRHVGMLTELMRPYPYRIVLPPLTVGEMVAAAEALVNITKAVLEMVAKGAISMQEARRILYIYGVQESDVPRSLDAQIEREIKAGKIIDPVEMAKKEAESRSAGGLSDRTVRAKSTSGGPGGAARGK